MLAEMLTQSTTIIESPSMVVANGEPSRMKEANEVGKQCHELMMYTTTTTTAQQCVVSVGPTDLAPLTDRYRSRSDRYVFGWPMNDVRGAKRHC